MGFVEKYQQLKAKENKSSQMLFSAGIPIILLSAFLSEKLFVEPEPSYFIVDPLSYYSDNPYLSSALDNMSGAWMPIAAGFMVLFYTFIRARFSARTAPQSNILWFRRFNILSKDQYPYHNVMKSMSQYGINCVTLQDNQVQRSLNSILSMSRPGGRLVMFMCAAAAIVTLLFAFIEFQGISDRIGLLGLEYQYYELSAQYSLIGLLAVVGAYGAIAITFLVLLCIYGVRGYATITNERQLSQQEQRLELTGTGKSTFRSGITIMKSTDDLWRTVVDRFARKVDAVVVDITELSDIVLDELFLSMETVGPEATVIFFDYEKSQPAIIDFDREQRIIVKIGEESFSRIHKVGYLKKTYSSAETKDLKEKMVQAIGNGIDFTRALSSLQSDE